MFKAIPIAIAVTFAAPIAAMAEPACRLYQYKANIISVTDGDTALFGIDLPVVTQCKLLLGDFASRLCYSRAIVERAFDNETTSRRI
jgi:hypothetical protein